MRETIDELAAAQQCNRSEAIRMLVALGIEAQAQRDRQRPSSERTAQSHGPA